jgi:hypothetical protein
MMAGVIVEVLANITSTSGPIPIRLYPPGAGCGNGVGFLPCAVLQRRARQIQQPGPRECRREFVQSAELECV